MALFILSNVESALVLYINVIWNGFELYKTDESRLHPIDPDSTSIELDPILCRF